MWFVGLIVGAIVGSALGEWGAILGAMLGIWLSLKWTKSTQALPSQEATERPKTETETPYYDNDMDARIIALEENVLQLNARIGQLEKALNINAPASPKPPLSSVENALQNYRNAQPHPTPEPPTPWEQWRIDSAAPSSENQADKTTLNAPPNQLISPPLAAHIEKTTAPIVAANKPTNVLHAPIRPPIRAMSATESASAIASAMTPEIESKPSSQPILEEAKSHTPAPPSFWAKIFGGNILAKIGVVLLFFGVASALKLAVEQGLFPISVRLLLGAVGAAAMVMFGWSRAQTVKHQMFGFALQGGGFAILYLIAYFMLTRYAMITPTWAFISYTLLGVSCTLMAAKQDSLSLAVLGISGAFLSPVLAANDGGSHITLFSYFTLLNVFVFALNWFKSWRQLNIVGFLFTLAIGMSWALRAYQPAHLNSTEFFLVLFFLMYSLEPVCYALFKQVSAMKWGDGLLLFGTPTVAVASQSVLMQPHEYGLAWSVFVMGLYYLALWGMLYRRNEATLKLAERSHLGIALTLLTYAVPLAFGAQVTSAIWTIEGCAVLWLGIRQDRHLARWTGIALQLLAGWYFAEHFEQLSRAHAVFNDVYLGGIIIAFAGMASGLMLHRWEKKTSQVSADSFFYWGLTWFIATTCAEIERFILPDYQDSIWLACFALTVFLLEIGGKHWSWLALRRLIWLLPISLGAIAVHAIAQHQHVLSGALTLTFPAAVALCHWLMTCQTRDECSNALPLLRAGLFWGVSVLVSNETAWVIQHYLSPNNDLWYWLPFGITFAAISMWRGIREDEPLARGLGMLIQCLSGGYLLAGYDTLPRTVAIFNDFYLGSALVTLLGLSTAWWVHRKAQPTPSAIADSMFYWGLAWLIAPNCMEISHFTAIDYQDAAWLGLIATVVGVLELIGKRENWDALRQMIWLLFIATLGIAADAIYREHHLLSGMLFPTFPAAIALYYWQLTRHERDAFDLGLRVLHLGMFWGLGGLIAHEFAWGVQQLTPNSELWHILCYGISFAGLILGTLAAHKRQIFPTTSRYADYVVIGLLPVVFANITWFAIANVGYSGEGSGLPYIPVLNPLDLVMLLSLYSIHQWIKSPQPDDFKEVMMYALPAGMFLWVSTLAARLAHHWGGIAFDWDILVTSYLMHALLSVIWTITSITLMIYASRKVDRKIWFIGFGLLAVVGAKLMLIDLRNTGTMTWTASLIGIALLVIAASYFSPAPPKKGGKE